MLIINVKETETIDRALSRYKKKVKDTQLFDLNSQTFVKFFDKKKFKLDISYRTAMIEAVRIASAEGVEFDPDTFTMINHHALPHDNDTALVAAIHSWNELCPPRAGFGCSRCLRP
jgi:hypothetical protein